MKKSEFLLHKAKYIKKLKEGDICVYPTDTIYGVGCNATKYNSVAKIRLLKKRSKKPFSIIIPDKSWIYNYCNVNPKYTKYIEKLPGPYTLILKLKIEHNLAANVVGGLDCVGVRIPDHWFSNVVKELKAPFVTTSVNYSGMPHITEVYQIPFEMRKYIDIIIDDGPCKGKPSTIIDLTKDEVEIVER